MIGSGFGIVASSFQAGGGFSPTDIAGLKIWLKADSLSLSDGDPVGTWADQSGLGNSPTSSGSNRPTYHTAVINGLPAVQFDGVDDYLTKSFTLAQPEHVFLVVRQDSWVLGGSILDGTSLFVMLIQQYPGTPSVIAYAGGFGPNPTSPLGWSLFEVLFNGASSEFRINAGSATTGDVGASNGGGITLGARGDTVSQYAAVTIAEVIVYDSALSSTDRGHLETYLMSKYGL
jgi:hypothetical protein